MFFNVLLQSNSSSQQNVDGGIPLTLGLCVLIFAIGFVVVHIIRPRLPRFYYPRIWNKGDYPPPVVSFANISWIFRALRTGRDDVALMGGLYGLLYLRFQLFMLLYCMVMSIIALPILLPINILGGGSNVGFSETTGTNVSKGSPLLFAHLVISIIFLLLGAFIIWWYQRIYFISRKHFRNRDFVNSHTVMVRNISRKIVNDSELHMFLESVYPGQQIFAHIGYNAPELLSLKQQKDQKIKTLSRLEYTAQKTGERTTITPGCCGFCLGPLGLRAEEDEMNYTKMRIGEISGKIQRRQQAPKKGSGVAFVSFDSALMAHRTIKDFYSFLSRRRLLSKHPDQDMVSIMNAKNWHVKQAPKPNELYINHFSTGLHEKRIRKLILFIVVLIVALLWSIPVAIFASFDTLKQIPGIGKAFDVFDHTVLKNFIQGFLPSFLTSLFVICLPFVLEFVIQYWEKPYSVSERNTSVMKNYFIFVLFNVLIFPSLFIGTLNSISIIYEKGIVSFISHIDFALQGAFFINYIINQTFVGGALRLSRLSEVFLYVYYLYYDAVTDVEKEAAKKRIAEMDYRTRFAQLMIVMAALMCFSTIVPLILPTGVLYFFISHILEKNNILHVYPKCMESDSEMIPAVINMFLISMILFEAAMIIFFYIKRQVVCFAIMCAMIPLTLLFGAFLNFLSWFNWYRYIHYGKPFLIDWDLPQSLLETAYIHPGVVPEDDNITERIDNCIKSGNDVAALRSNNMYERALAEHKELEQGESLLNEYNHNDDDDFHHDEIDDEEEMGVLNAAGDGDDEEDE